MPSLLFDSPVVVASVAAVRVVRRDDDGRRDLGVSAVVGLDPSQ